MEDNKFKIYCNRIDELARHYQKSKKTLQEDIQVSISNGEITKDEKEMLDNKIMLLGVVL